MKVYTSEIEGPRRGRPVVGWKDKVNTCMKLLEIEKGLNIQGKSLDREAKVALMLEETKRQTTDSYNDLFCFANPLKEEYCMTSTAILEVL